MAMLNTLNYSSALSDPSFSLTNRIIVTLMRNFYPKQSHVKETRYVVEDMTNNVLFLQIATGMHKDAKLPVRQIGRVVGDKSLPVLRFKRLQVLIRVCFGATNDKRQGQSFGKQARNQPS